LAEFKAEAGEGAIASFLAWLDLGRRKLATLQIARPLHRGLPFTCHEDLPNEEMRGGPTMNWLFYHIEAAYSNYYL
jgi:hypothetical protein